MQFAEISNSEKLFFKTFVDYDNPSLIHIMWELGRLKELGISMWVILIIC